MANVKNYVEPGGEVTVIGGTLLVTGELALGEGASVSGFPQAENVAASTATTAAGAVESINAILVALKAAGLMAPDAEGNGGANPA